MVARIVEIAIRERTEWEHQPQGDYYNFDLIAASSPYG